MKPFARCKATQRNCQKSQLFSWQTYAILNLSYLSMGGNDLLCVAPLVNKNANEGRLTCFNWTFRDMTPPRCAKVSCICFLILGSCLHSYHVVICLICLICCHLFFIYFHLFSIYFHQIFIYFHLFFIYFMYFMHIFM